MIGREHVRAEAISSPADVIPAERPAHSPAALLSTARAALLAHWSRLGLTAVLLLSAALNLIGLNKEGYANTYYAAAVKSMLTNWHNFFFASFDSAGFVSVDKPPLGLWIQAISARIFGFNAMSLLLPQALAGIAAVGLLYWLIRRTWGPVAGLVAALALAVTPITVTTDRNNTQDSLLILALLLAVWAASVATETGRLRTLILCAVMVGLGFNIKMLQAYLVLPALLLVYLVGAPRHWWTRVWHVALAGFVTLAVSLAWVIAVDLTPANQRPYVGSSGNNSALSLVLGYNGLTRLTLALPESVRNALTFLPGGVDLTSAPGMSPGIGDPGWLRLFNDGLGGQASWLLTLALAGFVAAAIAVRPRLPLDRDGQSLVIWGGWLLGAGGYFSVARFFHLYYLIMLGPAVAALAGIGIVALWRAWQRGGWRRALLPLALAGAALTQAHLLKPYTTWAARLTTPIVAACLAAAAILALVHLLPRVARFAAPAVATVAMLALLVTPLVWSVVSVQNGNGAAWLPEAGPESINTFANGGARTATSQGFGQAAPPNGGQTAPQTGGQGRAQQPRGNFGNGQSTTGTTPGNFGAAPGNQGNTGTTPNNRVPNIIGGRGGSGALTIAGAEWDVVDPNLVQFLRTNQGDAQYLVATTTSTYASVFMLATDQPALALGGYQGWDRILTPEQLAELVKAGQVRYFYLSTNAATGGFNNGTANQDATVNLTTWVRTNCSTVPATQWQGTATSTTSVTQRQGTTQGLQLYDCAAVATSQP
ncbi:MAG: glycosyltransferase family 39 protein [Thermomicrobiales bacterium]